MKKILCVLMVVGMLLALSVSVAANYALTGDTAYSYTVSEDGKTATVVVSLQNYSSADAMMLIPEYDTDALVLTSGQWLIRGVLMDDWNGKDAVIAFAAATDVNTEVFEMVFEIKGDASALDDVRCEAIVQSVEMPAETEPAKPETTEPKVETTEPKTETTEPAASEPSVSVPEEEEPAESETTKDAAVEEEPEEETEPEAEEETESENEPEPEPKLGFFARIWRWFLSLFKKKA